MRRVSNDRLQLGITLEFDIFNKTGALLAPAGTVLNDAARYRELLGFGFVEGPPPPTPTSPQALLADIGVLIADDNDLMRDILQKSLRSLGIPHILQAEDGEIALARIPRYLPDLVFLDIDMPRRDGLSTLKALRQDFPDLFVCMLSAHSSMENVRAALGAGASGFLVKPFQSNRLKSVIKQFIDKYKLTSGQ
jgi:two-component system chemotaxis response regulator CheY